MKSLRPAVLAGVAASAVAASFLVPTVTSAGAAPSAGDPRLDAQQAASAWVKGHSTALERAAADTFVRSGTFEGDNGIYSMAYERTHEGLRVVGGDFVVLADADGQVVGSSVAQEAPVDIASTTAQVPAARAAAVAKGQVDEVSDASAPELVIWHRDTGTRLAYEVEVRGTDAGEVSWQKVWVDAKDGSVLEAREQIAHGSGTAAYSGPNPLPIATSGSGSSYTMTDPTATTLRCQDAATNTTFSGTDDLWGNGNATNRETGCVDALYAAQQMKAMMSSWLGRSGMNGSGGWVPIRVGLNDINAYYDGTQVQIGKNQAGAWISSMDVVAHEFGHGVDDKTPGGISGGGTQEFIGDALAAATEYYDGQVAPYDSPDHTVGEEVNLVGQGPIRDGSNPANVGDPSCYSSSIPTAEVHAAAGPGDHWFYLLSRGGVSKCNGQSVTGLGEQAAIKVLYNAMLMKTSSSNYLKYRTWTLTAAKNLDSTCAQFNAVKAAWNAVNVPAQAADPTCGGTTTPPPTGGNILGNPGFESGATTWTGTAGPITNNTGRPARTGSWKLWLGGNGSSGTETINQSVTIPSTATAATLSYWIRTDTAESGSTAYDTMRVQVVDGSTATTLRSFSNVGTNATYTQFSHSLTAYKGKTVTIRFTMTEDSSLQTSFVVDDTALNVS
ncbi:M4 family metallopeptidase [Nocardioides cavernae]|uniref:M4 family metallopeptidase n=1 Tax=Nocardioides cavernae TaxID=1921566 RepID=A0ABR8N627_9ACTN|nr:M4 family metallopeptidase [Nocardioides cavernae]MBD3923619.1 M4 family metallopeptidase [Nocardioides cavernae]MBM7511451.1 Zn-dependent metalloprotease [Nocardioides cavernae]